MDEFIQLKPEDRRTAFVQAAAARQLSPEIVEKDFWVSWTLKEMFRLPAIGEHLIFKGGTSLLKVFKAIAEFHRPAHKAMPERFSRHYCDFYELVRRGVGASAVARLDLLARVTQHKSLFFKTSWAHYAEAVKGSLRVLPPEHRLKTLRADHAKMEQMFFGEPPEFDSILALLSEWELEFNQG